MLKFRTLKASEIDVRIQSISEKGLVLLLYKDARCDMNILDETVGPMNWKREHTRENANCIVSLWDESKKQWISKEDTGTESFTEKEKGLASDSFKRACFNWGIGRELYTGPFIWIKASDCEIKTVNNKKSCYDRFSVKNISYDDNKNIIGLSIRNNNTGKIVFTFGEMKGSNTEVVANDKATALYALGNEAGITPLQVMQVIKKDYNKGRIEDLTDTEYKEVYERLKAKTK